MCTFINFGTHNADNLPFYLTDSKGNKLDTGIADQGEPEGVIAFMTVVHKAAARDGIASQCESHRWD